MWRVLLQGVVLGCLFLCEGTNGQTYQDITDLYEQLFNGTYNRHLRPLFNQSESIQVNVTHILSSIETFNIQTGVLVTFGRFEISWHDEFLTWDPSHYGNKKIIPLSEGQYWKPLIVLAGITNEATIDNGDFSPAWVTYEGHVETFPAGNYITNCDVDPSIFPFDKHECFFDLYSSVHMIQELNFNSPYGDIRTDDIVEHAEWSVEKTGSQVQATLSGPLSPANIRNTVVLRRRSLIIMINDILPILLLGMLQTFSVFVPITCGERLSFSITVYLAAIIVLVAVWVNTPTNSLKIPLTSYQAILFYCVNTAGTVWHIYATYLSKLSLSDLKISKIVRKYVLNAKRKRQERLQTGSTPSSRSTQIEVIDIAADMDDDQINSARQVTMETDNLEIVTGVDVVVAFDRVCLHMYLVYYILLVIVNIAIFTHLY